MRQLFALTIVVEAAVGSNTPAYTTQHSIILLIHLTQGASRLYNVPPPTRLLVPLFGLFNWRGHLKLGLHGISTVRYADTDYP